MLSRALSIKFHFALYPRENFACVDRGVRGVARNVVTTSHLSPSRRSHNIHVRYVGTCERATGGGGSGSGKETARVCYRYRATWPRGDRDNGSPPLLSPRRFASPRTYIPSHPFQLAPLRLADSYFRATSRTRQAFPYFRIFVYKMEFEIAFDGFSIDFDRFLSLFRFRQSRIKGEKGIEIEGIDRVLDKI